MASSQNSKSKSNSKSSPGRADEDRGQELFDKAEKLLVERGEDPNFVFVALEFLDERSLSKGKSAPVTVNWYLKAFNNLKRENAQVEELQEKAERRRRLREKYMVGFDGQPKDELGRQRFNEQHSQESFGPWDRKESQ